MESDSEKWITVNEIGHRDPEPTPGEPFPGWRTSPLATWALLGANVVVWLAVQMAGGAQDLEVLLEFGALFGPLIADGQYWRLLTAMFLHADLPHLAVNGIGLLIFGQLVEKSYGRARFLAIYVLAGLFGSVASFMLNSAAIGVGASGAIFGVVGALAAYFLSQRSTMGETARRNLIGVAILAAISLGYGMTTPGIDNWAHVGGLLGGFLLGLALSPRYREETSNFGFHVRLVDTISLAKRWWVLPAAVAFLVAGVWLGSANVPESAFAHVNRAEDYYRDGDLARALQEVDKAIDLQLSTARAHYLRALIYIDRGNAGGAVAELRTAIQIGRFSDRETMREALALLVRIRPRQ